jgi:hypothetical protein
MTKDLNNHKWADDDDKSVEILITRGLGIFLGFTGTLTLTAILYTSFFQAPEVDHAYNHTVSPEMRAYIHGPGKDKFMTNWDVE